tara:strand:+ start:1225 stop:2010 length:786 start_codon:yes stop_codon:yes gene_type:complete
MDQLTEHNLKVICIIPAAGKSSRFRSGNKLNAFIEETEDVLSRTIKNIESIELIEKIFVGLNLKDIQALNNSIQNNSSDKKNAELFFSKVKFYEGGKSRQNTVFNGLNQIRGQKIDDIENVWVIIHDAARPVILPNDILDFINSAIKINKSSIMAVPISDTIKKVDKENNIIRTISRNEMWLAQTPQIFRFGILFESLKYCIENSIEITDESQALEIHNHEYTIIKGKPYNIKITEDIDLIHARCLANINDILLENEECDD